MPAVRLLAAVSLALVLAYPPIVNAETDFELQSVLASPSRVSAGGNVTVTVTVSNIGSQADSVYVSVYLSPDTEVTPDDTHLTTTWMVNITGGETRTGDTTVTLPDNLATGSYYLGAIVIPAAEPDPNPINDTGVALITVDGASCDLDEFEHDDSAATARWINVNSTREHNHCDDPDDWLMFSAVAGTTYGVQNEAISHNYHSVLRIYDQDGKTLLAATEPGLFENPRLLWTAPASGTYFIQSRSLIGFYSTGADTSYAVTLADALADLEILEFHADTVYAVVGGTASIYSLIANTGFAITGRFDHGLYLSSDPEVTRDDLRVGYRAFDGVSPDPSGELAWTVAAFPSSLAGGTYYLGAIADDQDSELEYFEDNNASPVVPVQLSAPECQPDLYEDDDLRDFASPIATNTAQIHDHCEDPFDWVYYDAMGGTKYFVRALNETTGVPDGDRVISVYDASNNELASGDGLVEWTPAASGRYHILVWSRSDWPRPSPYTLAVLQDLPDLTVQRPYAGEWLVPRGGVLEDMSHWINNIGFVDSAPTKVGYYLSSDSIIEPGDQRLGEAQVPGLPVGSTAEGRDRLVLIPTGQPTGVFYLGSVVDDIDLVPEFDESNNGDSNPRYLEIVDPICTPDGYDDDDTAALARAIRPDELQTRNFCDDGHDWLLVSAQQGITYAFESADAGADAHVILDLYDTDGATVLGAGERSSLPGDRRGWLAFTAPASASYFVRTLNKRSWDLRAHYGSGTDYSLHLSTCNRDAFEEDDSAAQAGSMGLGENQRRNHCDDGLDWVALAIAQADEYLIATGELAANADTLLELYDSDGQTVLAQNDDARRNRLDSRIVWTFAQPGTYFVKTAGKNRGPETDYTLSVTRAKGGGKK